MGTANIMVSSYITKFKINNFAFKANITTLSANTATWMVIFDIYYLLFNNSAELQNYS